MWVGLQRGWGVVGGVNFSQVQRWVRENLGRYFWYFWGGRGREGIGWSAGLTIGHRPTSPTPEHQNFFGLDETLGPVAVSLRREEKEGSGGGTLHSYRVIVRTTQVRWDSRLRRRVPSTTADTKTECPYIPSLAPDPPWHHLGGRTASRPPEGPIPEEASGTRGSAAEPNLPAPGFRLPQGAPHAAHSR